MDAQGRKAAAWMEHLHRTTTLTKDGGDWLTVAIDPFHDTDVKCQGLPDMATSQSIVQVIKQTIQVSQPVGVSGTWDAHFFTLPWVTAVPMSRHTVKRNVLSTDSTFDWGSWGGLMAITVPTGNPSFDTGSVDGPGHLQVGVPERFLQGSARVVAMGFEVVNTTNPLHKQGQVIVYRMPQPVPRPSAYAYASGLAPAVIVGTGSYCDVTAPPNTAAAALNLAGSRQWDAKEGSYSVVTFSSLDIPADGDSWADPIFRFSPASEDAQQVLIPTLNTAVGSSLGPSQTALYPLNTSGAYYTGLSPETTLSVTFNVYVERFPSAAESDLVVLATPSPAYDITALQLYTHAMRDMPPGVMQKMNGFGDWFAGVAQKVSGAVSKIAGMFPHPVAQAVSQGAGVVSGVAGSFTVPGNSRAPALTHQKQPKQIQKPKESSVDQRQDRALAKLENQVQGIMRAMPKAQKPKKKRRG